MSPIYDQGDSRLKLLGAGVAITDDLIDRLSKRGITNVVVDEADLARLMAFQPAGVSTRVSTERKIGATTFQTHRSRELDAALIADDACILKPQGTPFNEQLPPPRTDAYDTEIMNQLVEHHLESVEQVGELQNKIVNDSADPELLQQVMDDSLKKIVDDMDLFVCLGINPSMSSYPSQQSVNSSMLAVSMGIAMQWDRPTLLALGMGCLLHDIGMLRVKQYLHQSTRLLDENEFREITKHPILSIDSIQKSQIAIPAASNYVVYQMHERCNGTGYPRGQTADAIHPLAKIAAVADVYIALVSSRPHRQGMMPYAAIEYIIRNVSTGVFDAESVRCLLKTVSLFPIGSYVELTNGHVGRVIRANKETYDRPVVEHWEADQGHSEAVVSNLAEDPELKVAKAIPRLRAA